MTSFIGRGFRIDCADFIDYHLEVLTNLKPTNEPYRSVSAIMYSQECPNAYRYATECAVVNALPANVQTPPRSVIP